MTAIQSPDFRAVYQSGKYNNTTQICFDTNMDFMLVLQSLGQTFKTIVVSSKQPSRSKI